MQMQLQKEAKKPKKTKNKQRKKERKMACKDAKRQALTLEQIARMMEPEVMTTRLASSESLQTTEDSSQTVERLLFGVDSKGESHVVLQNNLSEFEWVVRNKLYPNFWGRNINGDNALTKEEITFIHEQGTKIAPIFSMSEGKETEAQGLEESAKAATLAVELNIPMGTTIFLEVPETENVTTEFMRGYIHGLLEEGFVPGFMANTDAKYEFDREFSRGMQTDKQSFETALVWATAPSLQEYERVTTTHLIHPDVWVPFAPSGITRNQIAVWQYGKECHPIFDDKGKEKTFNINLVRNEQVIIHRMF